MVSNPFPGVNFQGTMLVSGRVTDWKKKPCKPTLLPLKPVPCHSTFLLKVVEFSLLPFFKWRMRNKTHVTKIHLFFLHEMGFRAFFFSLSAKTSTWLHFLLAEDWSLSDPFFFHFFFQKQEETGATSYRNHVTAGKEIENGWKVLHDV